ncbi:lipopolysaccharide biosynthesis protein [Pedobacter sp. SYSU D00535]|uniref:lipopolysaccharide biosynthesis protein n=1 Tax=Pedobacter sp. SYSU D00535 TaxID=2810308 RepID=UPI001A95AD12|nr:lipopolysaccharide biosynthesis protein [Pedobacter sp. SYSU D00535]
MKNPLEADDEISVKELGQKVKKGLRFLSTKWPILLLAAIVGSISGLIYSSYVNPIYSAQCTFVLEEEGKGGLGQYSGLASMVGIDLGGGRSGIFAGENIIELYKSRRMIEKTLLAIDSSRGERFQLIERFISTEMGGKVGSTVLKEHNLRFDIAPEAFTDKHNSIVSEVVNEIRRNHLIVEKPDRKLSIISVVTKSRDELLAKSFTENIVRNVNNFYIETKTKKSLNNLTLLRRQADSIRRVLNMSITGIAEAADVNPNANPALRILNVPSQRRQIDVQANSAMYSEIVKNLEIASMSLRRETPLIQVIDEPVLPLPYVVFTKLKGIIIGTVLSLILTIGVLVFREAFNMFFS